MWAGRRLVGAGSPTWHEVRRRQPWKTLFLEGWRVRRSKCGAPHGGAWGGGVRQTSGDRGGGDQKLLVICLKAHLTYPLVC